MSEGKKVPLEPTVKPKKPAVNGIFLDSGAFSLYNKKVPTRQIIKNHEFFKTQEFWDYVDTYAEFLKQHGSTVDYYANCDAIYDPKTSYEVLKYLENEYGLNPVPVVHSMTGIHWVEKYIEEGYDLIGFGGAGSAGRHTYKNWADHAFHVVCSTEDRTPSVRVHGFAITAYNLLRRYPWWSTDSTSWSKWAGYGIIYVPRLHKNEFDFERDPFPIFVSQESPYKKIKRHISTISPEGVKSINSCYGIVRRWLDEIEVPLGSKKKWGVVSENSARVVANLRFFERVIESLPDWPFPFEVEYGSDSIPGTSSFGKFTIE